MVLNRDNINELRKDVLLHQARSDTLVDHVGARRVTHTIRSVIRLVITLSKMVNVVQADSSYVRLLKRAFDKAYDPKGGSMEFQIYEDGTVFIRGSFSVAALRERLMTVPQESDTVIEGEYNSDG